MYESIKEIKTLMSKERASALSSTPVRASLERRVHCPPVLFFVSVFYIYFPHLSSAPPDQPLACEPASRSPHAFQITVTSLFRPRSSVQGEQPPASQEKGS
jgi:hypothetical protein